MDSIRVELRDVNLSGPHIIQGRVATQTKCKQAYPLTLPGADLSKEMMHDPFRVASQ